MNKNAILSLIPWPMAREERCVDVGNWEHLDGRVARSPGQDAPVRRGQTSSGNTEVFNDAHGHQQYQRNRRCVTDIRLNKSHLN
ncbi:hypothetical protein RR46_12645 [Papilio xuthus]|uniref:Uncharacterized protein n=1 Tax=Papilio xuthus TaxID=66420 RepID=A0A194PZM5_PAPXU|nr:hypothetical protein RR46_12645 [Papilio xuthus]